MSDKNEMLYIVAGLAVGAVVVYILMNETAKTSITELSRDEKGHVISIVQKRV
jgi:hypothetical protein